MSLPKLAYEANQIGRFFASVNAATAAVGIADHMRRFWDPRMRAAIVKYLDEGGDGLDEPVRAAVEQLRTET